MRSADEIAYEITAVYYDDDKVAEMIRRAREEMRDECIKAAGAVYYDCDDLVAKLRAIPNR